MKLTGAGMADGVSTRQDGSNSFGKVLVFASSAAASQLVAVTGPNDLIALFSAGRRRRLGSLFTAFACFGKDLSGRGAARNFIRQSIGVAAKLGVSLSGDRLKKHLNVEQPSDWLVRLKAQFSWHFL